MRAGLRNLRQKDGIFIFRRKVPAPLQPIIKRRELIRSLGRCSAREAQVKAAQLWAITERIFQMFADLLTEEGLITPDQVKLFIDTMVANYRFSEEWIALTFKADLEDGPPVPIDLKILKLLHKAKLSRACLAENDLSSVKRNINVLSKRLEIPIESGSVAEKIIGREMLRELANYYEESARRECKERDLPTPSEYETLSLHELKVRLREYARYYYKSNIRRDCSLFSNSY